MPADYGPTAQLTIGEEESYGSRAVDPSRGLRFTSESLRLARDYVTDVAAGVGDYDAADVLRVLKRRNGGGQVTLEVLPRGFGMIFKHMLGSIESGTPAITALGGEPAAYQQTFVPAPLCGAGHSLTVQKGVPDGPGSSTLVPVNLLGCMVDSWQMDFAAGSPLTTTLHMLTRETEDPSSYKGDSKPELDRPDYPGESSEDLLPFALTGDEGDPDRSGSASLLIDGAEIAVVSAGRICADNGLVSNPSAFEDADAAGEPTDGGNRAISGLLCLEFRSLAAVHQAFFGDDPVALVLQFFGRPISGENREMLRITLPDVRFPSGTPVNVPGIPMVTCPFIVLRASESATDEATTIEYVTADNDC